MKKLLLTFILFLIPTIGHCATYYWCTTPGTANWSTGNNWTSVMADQGTCAANGTAPTASDTAIINSSSGNISLDSATADVAATVTMTGFTGTFTPTTNDILIVSGNVTLPTAGTFTFGAGTGTLKILAASTIVGTAWPGPFNAAVAGTITFNNGGASFVVTGLCTVSAAAVFNLTTTGDTLTCNGGLTSSANWGTAGTATVVLGGGTWTQAGFIAQGNITLAGNVTFANGSTIEWKTGTFLYSSGTITTTGNTFALAGTGTFNTSGMNFNIFETLGVNTMTLLSNFSATTFYNGNENTTFSGAYNVTVANLLDFGNSVSIALVAGQTLTITNSILSTTTGSGASTIKSATASSPTYVVYTGPVSGENITNTTFTDVQVSAPPVPFYGPSLLDFTQPTYPSPITTPSLTRTTGVKLVTASNFQPKQTRYPLGV